MVSGGSGDSGERSRALSRVAKGALCAGCGGCALIAPDAIEMTMAPPGFLRPQQIGPIAPEDEARIAAICPGLGQSVEAQGRPDDPLWGPYLQMQTGWATDATLRHTASSGGALSAVLTHLLDSGAVDGVVQTGPGVPAVATATVISTDGGGVQSAAGSRYAPSAPLADLGPYLDGTGRYAFVGKPCDIAALRALAEYDPRVSERFVVMISFFCAGVPSQAGAEEVLRNLGATPEEVTAFRYRGMGWPGRATARLKDGSERSMSYAESWGQVLSRHVQHRCKICADGTGRAADLVCADAWEVDDRGYPLFEEADGVSLIVARTKIGQALMAEAERAGHLQTGPFDVAQLVHLQPGQRNRSRALAARLAGLRLTGRPVPDFRGLHIGRAARQNGLRTNIRNFLGMARRALTGRV